MVRSTGVPILMVNIVPELNISTKHLDPVQANHYDPVQQNKRPMGQDSLT